MHPWQRNNAGSAAQENIMEKKFKFSANGLDFGVYAGASIEEAQEVFAQDAGYKSWAAMVEQAEEFGGNSVESEEVASY
jgi:hypothetical protein